MRSLRQVGLDEVLTAEQGRYIKDKAVYAARQAMTGRKLFSVIPPPLGVGVQEYRHYTLTEASAAAIDFSWPGAESKDLISLAPTTVAIPLLHKETEINKVDLASSQMMGTPLNVSNVESIAYRVALLEDALLLDGYAADGTNYDINGLYQGAGNSEGTALDWGTAANIITSINNCFTLMNADNITGPFNVTLHPTQYNQARALIGTTDRSYLQWIEDQLQGGIVQWTPGQTAGTGLMSKADNAGFFDYILAEDVTTYNVVLQRSGNLFVKVYVRGLPVIYDSNALCQMTSI